MRPREAKALRLPEQRDFLEAIGVPGTQASGTQAAGRREADRNGAHHAEYVQTNRGHKDDNLQQRGESSGPQFIPVRDTSYLNPEEAWQEVPDYVFFEEPADQCHDTYTDSPEPADDSDIPEHVRARKRGGRRHKGHFMKRPMAMAEVIEELQHPELRENALRCLSGHLIERREVDVEFYRQAGFFLFYSCSTVAVLLQEVKSVYDRLNAKDLKVRGSKRLSNVLTLLQSIAANEETRWDFVKAGIPNYLMPFILANYSEEVYENIRAISLSVIGVLCQARDIRIIKWAIESDMIEACIFSLEIGCELSKVVLVHTFITLLATTSKADVPLHFSMYLSCREMMISRWLRLLPSIIATVCILWGLAMAILESMFRKNEGIVAMCEKNAELLPKFFKICGDLVNILGEVQGFSPRLLFLIVRVLILLCQNRRSVDLLKDQLPRELQDSTFDDLKMEYPLFNYLVHQLLLYTGKATHHMPSIPTPTYLGPSTSWGLMEVDMSATLALTHL